jgi:hypothetical protein
MGGDDALAQFRSALFHRDVIDCATGLLMQRDALTETQALQALLRPSRVRQTQLARAACSVVDDYIGVPPLFRRLIYLGSAVSGCRVAEWG